MSKVDIKYKVLCMVLVGLIGILGFSSLYAAYYQWGYEYDLSNPEDLEDFENRVEFIESEIEKIENDTTKSREEKNEAIKAYEEDIQAINKYPGYQMSVDISNTYNNASNATDDFWGQAQNWFNQGSLSDSLNEVQGEESPVKVIIDEFANMVNLIGTVVIVLVTIFLGIKYMYGSFESKASVKEGLLNLLVACVFFFGWNAIWSLLFNGNNLALVDDTFEGTIAKVFNILTTIANFVAIGVVIFIGVKYILAGAKGKAELKLKSSQFLIGIIMAFCAIGLLNYISAVINSVLSTS